MKEIIDHKKIKMQDNYVLIKPDGDQEKFHINGVESQLYVGKSAMVYVDPEDSLDFEMKETMDTFADHWSITGTVISVPVNLKFYADEISKILNRSVILDSDVLQVNRLANASMKYECPIEIKEGDKVLFDSQVHITVAEQGEFIDTDLGRLYMIRYDRLRGIVKEKTVYPLNSVVFFKWIQPEEISLGSLSLSLEKKRIWDLDTKEVQIGEVLEFGYPVRREMEGAQMIPGSCDKLEKGTRFIFNSISANNAETEGHFHLFGGEEIMMIRQSGILAVLE